MVESGASPGNLKAPGDGWKQGIDKQGLAKSKGGTRDWRRYLNSLAKAPEKEEKGDATDRAASPFSTDYSLPNLRFPR